MDNFTRPAPNDARFAAFIIDSIVVGVITGFMQVVKPLALLSGFAGVFYFTICHSLTGQTLGKKLLNIHVISSEGGLLTFKQSLRRETLGRLAAAVLVIGYLRIFFSEDRRGWHDMIAGSEVLSLDAIGRRGTSSAWKPIAAAFGALGTIAAIGLFVLFYTPIPLRAIAKELELSGMVIEKISGNLAQGFSVQRFASKDERAEVELENVRFEYDLLAAFTRGELIINRISVNGGSFKALAPAKKSEPDLKPQAESAPLPPPKTKKAFRGKIRVDRIDIANLHFSTTYLPTNRAFELKRFFVDQLSFSNEVVSVNRVWVEGDAFAVDLNSLQISKGFLKSAKTSRITVRASAFPEFLRQDLVMNTRFDLEFAERLQQGSKPPFKLNDLMLATAGNRIQILKDGDGYSLKTYGYTPGEFFVASSPLKGISITTHATWPEKQLKLLSGSFILQGRTFNRRADGKFAHLADHRVYELETDPMTLAGLLVPVLPKFGSPFTIAGTENESVEEWLSSLYYGKKTAELSPEEQKIIAGDLPHFASNRVAAFSQVLRSPTAVAGSNPAETARQQVIQGTIDRLAKACTDGNSAACGQVDQLRNYLKAKNLQQ